MVRLSLWSRPVQQFVAVSHDGDLSTGVVYVEVGANVVSSCGEQTC